MWLAFSQQDIYIWFWAANFDTAILNLSTIMKSMFLSSKRLQCIGYKLLHAPDEYSSHTFLLSERKESEEFYSPDHWQHLLRVCRQFVKQTAFDLGGCWKCFSPLKKSPRLLTTSTAFTVHTWFIPAQPVIILTGIYLFHISTKRFPYHQVSKVTVQKKWAVHISPFRGSVSSRVIHTVAVTAMSLSHENERLSSSLQTSASDSGYS